MSGIRDDDPVTAAHAASPRRRVSRCLRGMFGVTNNIIGLAGAIAAATGHSSFGTIDSTDLGKLIAAVPARAMNNTKFYVSVVGFGASFVRIAGGSSALTSAVVDGGFKSFYLGFPIVFCSALTQSQASRP